MLYTEFHDGIKASLTPVKPTDCMNNHETCQRLNSNTGNIIAAPAKHRSGHGAHH